jgi:hypothetical protein
MWLNVVNLPNKSSKRKGEKGDSDHPARIPDFSGRKKFLRSAFESARREADRIPKTTGRLIYCNNERQKRLQRTNKACGCSLLAFSGQRD